MQRDQWQSVFDKDGASDLIYEGVDMTLEKLKKRRGVTTYYVEKHMYRASEQIKVINPRYGPVIEVVLDFLFDTGVINDASIVKLNDDGRPGFDLTNDNADDIAALNSAVIWSLREARANKTEYAKRFPQS